MHCMVVYAVRNSLNRWKKIKIMMYCTDYQILSALYIFLLQGTTSRSSASYCDSWVQLTQLQQIDWTIKRSCNVKALFKGVTLDLTELSVVWKATGYVTQGSPAAIIHRSRLLPLVRVNSPMIEMDSHIFLVILILTSQFKFVIYCSRFT